MTVTAMLSDDSQIIAVDIGNSRIKLGRFAAEDAGEVLPQPEAAVQVATAGWDEDELRTLFAGTAPAEFHWLLGSVNRPATAVLQAWLAAQAVPESKIRLLAHRDLPLTIALAAPEKVGIDRLLGAVAANHLRGADQPAIAIDVGSAITIDLIDADGAFRGGAILPGIGMGARALHTFTDLLPQSELSDLTASPPEPVGTDTVSAIHAGLFWGAIGSMREIVYRVQQRLDQQPLVLLTGGAAPLVSELLAGQPGPMNIQCVPHLVLGGTVLARQRQP